MIYVGKMEMSVASNEMEDDKGAAEDKQEGRQSRRTVRSPTVNA
jgi:hypothetical protein